MVHLQEALVVPLRHQLARQSTAVAQEAHLVAVAVAVVAVRQALQERAG